jgi:hypothetical protein
MMSDRIDKFCSSLNTKLNDLEGHMSSFKAKLQSAPKQAEEALHKQLNQAQQTIEAQKESVAKAKTSVQNWLDQKKAEVKATIDGWKANHEAKKLAHRADRAEDYAAAAVQVAMSSMDEAEHAVLEAIAARHDAEAVTAG